MNVIRILRAKLRNKNKLKKEKWYRDRLDACSKCPLNSKNVDRQELSFWQKMKYNFWLILNLKQTFCTICGCEIKAKASEPLEECSKEVNKEWEQIN